MSFVVYLLLCNLAPQGATSRGCNFNRVLTNIAFQKYCLKVRSNFVGKKVVFKIDVQKWHQKVTSKSDVKNWHPKLMSKSELQKGCPKVNSKSAFQKWCPKLTSQCDIPKRRQNVPPKMMSKRGLTFFSEILFFFVFVFAHYKCVD